MIDTKLLRQKILDLAIRGKLVPQDPKDEPASELLKKIKAEKEALIKAGKLKRDKHESFIFRGDDKRYYEQIDGKTTDITKEIPFNLPDGWVWYRLIVLYNFIDYRGKTPTKLSNGVPLITAKNVKKGYISYIPSDFISETEYEERKSRGVSQKGDILFTTEAPLGNAAIADLDKFSAGQRIITLQQYARENQFSNHLQLFFILSPYFQNLLNSKHTGSTVAGIKAERLKQLLLPLPPLAEQKRIVTQIESLLKCVDEIDRESETLEKSLSLAKQKILDLAIRGKLVPQDPKDEPASELLKKIKAEKEALIKAGKLKRDKHESFIFRGDDNCYHENIDGKNNDITKEVPFEISDSWEWVRFSFLIQVISGTSYDKKDICSQGIRILRGGNIQDSELHFFEDDVFLPMGYYDEEKSIRLNDVIIVASTGSKAAIGKPAFVDHPVENAQIGAFLRIARPCISQQSAWINIIFASEYYREHIRDCVKGTNINNIKQEHITELLIPLPPLAEQKRIVSQVEKLFPVLETMRG